MASKKSSKTKSKTSTKKVVKKSSKGKSRSSSKTTAKKSSRKTKEEPIKAIKKTYSNAQVVEKIAEKLEGSFSELEDKDAVCKRIVKQVFDSYSRLVLGSIAPGGAGTIKLFGLMNVKIVKVKAKKMPAIKKGTMVFNPFEGKEVPHKGRKAFTKPAYNKVKILAMKRLKDAAND